MFYGEIWLSIPKVSLLLLLIWSTALYIYNNLDIMLLNSNGSTLKYIMSRTNWKYVVHVNFTLLHITCAEDPRYNDSVCYQRFCCQIEFAVIKKLDMDPSKA